MKGGKVHKRVVCARFSKERSLVTRNARHKHLSKRLNIKIVKDIKIGGPFRTDPKNRRRITFNLHT